MPLSREEGYERNQALPPACMTRETTKRIRNIPNRTRAIFADVAERPRNPSTAAIIAITRNVIDQLSIGFLRYN
jgi:hypothetical protein